MSLHDSDEYQSTAPFPPDRHGGFTGGRGRGNETERARGESSYSAGSRAGSAYRNAMPPLDGHNNIRDFIACVAQGVLLGAIEYRQSSKLLYAAQVALSAIRLRQGTAKSATAA